MVTAASSDRNARRRWRDPNGLALPKKAPGRLITSEQFLDWVDEDTRADLIGGQIFMHSPVSLRHADLLNFLHPLTVGFVQELELGVVHRENVAVRLSVRETFLPDLAYFTNEQRVHFHENHIATQPTLAVEVLSPSTADNDRIRKFAAYELHQVQEYWLLDPRKLEHRFFHRSGEQFVEFAQGEERVTSFSLPGFWLERAWLNPERLPKVGACLSRLLATAKRNGRR